MMAADSKTIADLMAINPLIDDDRNTSGVECALDLLSFLMLDAAADGLALSSDQTHGLAFMLDTCRAALKVMRTGEVAE